MGKFIPKESRSVDAFQWKPNSEGCIMELLSYLRREHISFELFAVRSDVVSVLIGEDEQQVRVDPMEYVVFDGEDEYKVFANSTLFFERYRSLP